MISSKTRELINLALLNLELKNPTQEAINKATNYLKDAILQIKKENFIKNATVEDMINNADLKEGDVVKTKGYYNVDDNNISITII